MDGVWGCDKRQKTEMRNACWGDDGRNRKSPCFRGNAMKRVRRSQMPTLADQNAENAKMPKKPKNWISPANARFSGENGDFWHRGM